MRRLVNDDPHCRQQDDCRATGTGLCRQCAMASGRMSAARKAAWADPEVRARMSAASKARAWQPPTSFADLYAVLKRKVGSREARRLVEADIARAAAR